MVLPRELSFYGLVPRCQRHRFPKLDRDKRGRPCNRCRKMMTPATADAVAELAHTKGLDPRVLAVRALQHVHPFATEAGVVRALQRAGIRNTPELRSR